MKKIIKKVTEGLKEILSIIPELLDKEICITIRNLVYKGIKIESVEFRIKDGVVISGSQTIKVPLKKE